MINRLLYWKRIFSTYLTNNKSNLSFWHGEPSENENSSYKYLDQYYMTFKSKANYDGHYDHNGIPLLHYHGDIGLQYNPIAISQWSLGNYNLWKSTGNENYYIKFISGADWLVNNLNKNSSGVYVWQHKFNWVYKENLINPWYSGLAQGQGLSVLCRAFKETNNQKYLESLKRVFESFQIETRNGGVTFIDKNKNIWIEEYIMENEPTHILNGFIWALWGIYDYWLLTSDKKIKILFDKYSKTISNNINLYDTGYWSLYELSNLRIKMQASTFYHSLHIVQLEILFKMTGEKKFKTFSQKWTEYSMSKLNVIKSTTFKILFKICYY